jgi:uncharacterized protein
MAYLRIATHPGIFGRPLTQAVATENVARLVALPHVQTPGEHERFWDRYRDAALDADPRGNLIPDGSPGIQILDPFA